VATPSAATICKPPRCDTGVLRPNLVCCVQVGQRAAERALLELHPPPALQHHEVAARLRRILELRGSARRHARHAAQSSARRSNKPVHVMHATIGSAARASHAVSQQRNRDTEHPAYQPQNILPPTPPPPHFQRDVPAACHPCGQGHKQEPWSQLQWPQQAQIGGAQAAVGRDVRERLPSA
jgi:hypothetical protein